MRTGLFAVSPGWRLALCLACFLGLRVAGAAPLQAGSAHALGEAHSRLQHRLAHDPIVLDSVETPEGLQGDVYATTEHSLADVHAALGSSGQWCEMLKLHINNRRCRAEQQSDSGGRLTLGVVRRYDQPVDDAFVLSFDHRTLASNEGYLAVELASDEGPLGTSHYRVVLEAIPLGGQRTFLHFGYAYEHNTLARLATTAYLATFGSDKRGFTVVGRQADGTPDYIRGLRGLVERNAMRYFLALDAYLGALDAPSAERLDKRLNRWFDGVERYPTQLREVDRATYLAQKSEDRRRDGEPGR